MDTGRVAVAAAEPRDVIMCIADIIVTRKPCTVEHDPDLRSVSRS